LEMEDRSGQGSGSQRPEQWHLGPEWLVQVLRFRGLLRQDRGLVRSQAVCNLMGKA
jgi:hypothetical protein